MGCESERAHVVYTRTLSNNGSGTCINFPRFMSYYIYINLTSHPTKHSGGATDEKAGVGMERLAAISCDNTNNIQVSSY